MAVNFTTRPKKNSPSIRKQYKPKSNRRLTSLVQIQRNSKNDNNYIDDDKAALESLALRSEKSLSQHDIPGTHETQNEPTQSLKLASAQTRRAFGAHLRKAIQESDVIIEVLDARDPNGFRSIPIENEIISMGKKLILLLNKVDLVADPNIVAGWEKYLRQFYPTISFRSMTTSSRSKKSSSKLAPGKATQQAAGKLASGYEAAGTGELMNLLKNYTRTDKERNENDCDDSKEQPTSMTDSEGLGGGEMSLDSIEKSTPTYKNIIVGVIGMPNVGKSSTINSLCRNSNRVKTGNVAGITREMTRIRLSKNIQLLDTPGVILEDMDPALLILKGCVKNYDEADAEKAVDLLRRAPGVVDELVRLYGVSHASCVQEEIRLLLYEIAQKRKLFLKGGVANMEAAVRLVLEDWRNGDFKSVQAHPPAIENPQTKIQIMTIPSKALEF